VIDVIQFDPRVDETLRQDFMHELQILSELDHPGIVQIYGACVTPPNLCMVLELCSTSLYALLHNTAQPVSEKQIVTMAVSLCVCLPFFAMHALPRVVLEYQSIHITCLAFSAACALVNLLMYDDNCQKIILRKKINGSIYTLPSASCLLYAIQHIYLLR
jgi:hypothetical protein